MNLAATARAWQRPSGCHSERRRSRGRAHDHHPAQSCERRDVAGAQLRGAGRSLRHPVGALLAVLQILVYAGAIMVLFVFVVMMVNREESTPIAGRDWSRAPSGSGGWLRVLPGRLAGGSRTRDAFAGSFGHAPVKDFGTVSSVGALLFSGLSLSLRGISLLLLVAVIGG